MDSNPRLSLSHLSCSFPYPMTNLIFQYFNLSPHSLSNHPFEYLWFSVHSYIQFIPLKIYGSKHVAFSINHLKLLRLELSLLLYWRSNGSIWHMIAFHLETSTLIPYSSKFSWHKNFMKHSKLAKLLIFVVKISWLLQNFVTREAPPISCLRYRYPRGSHWV